MAGVMVLVMPRCLPLAVWSLSKETHVPLLPAHDVQPVIRDLQHNAVSQWLAARGVPVIFAYSPLLLRKPVGWGQHCHVTGPWLPLITAAPLEGMAVLRECRSRPLLCAAMPSEWPLCSDCNGIRMVSDQEQHAADEACGGPYAEQVTGCTSPFVPS